MNGHFDYQPKKNKQIMRNALSQDMVHDHDSNVGVKGLKCSRNYLTTTRQWITSV